LDGRYLTVSVGGRTTEFRCSICNNNWLNYDEFMECPHVRSETYEDELCYLIVGPYTNDELSWVNCPADQLARAITPNVEIGLGEEWYRVGILRWSSA
jgi:hypothetical protein